MYNLKTEILTKKTTIILFILMAMFPLFKPNIVSWIIITYTIFTVYYLIKEKKKIKINLNLISYTIIFWMFLIYELFSKRFELKEVLLHLHFLILPLLFFYLPPFINNKLKNKAIIAFQVSVLIQSFYFLFLFLFNNPVNKLFYISEENIPFFRNYVFNHSLFKIHPTYFSAFLLVSLTISLFYHNKRTILNMINVLISIFFILMFSSRIIIVITLLTIFYYFFQIVNNERKQLMKVISLMIFVSIITLLFFNKIIYKRFNEIRTEISNPPVNAHHNSTNIRVAINKCSVLLIKKIPFFGYGNQLQNTLNNCYAKNYSSNFYINTNYNTHNYYFHILLFGGWLFLIMFFVYLIKIWISIQNFQIAKLIFIQILLINLTENFFSRYYGLILFIYFMMLFITFNNKRIE